MGDRSISVHLQPPLTDALGLAKLPSADEFAAQILAGLQSEEHCFNPIVIQNGRGAVVEFLAPSRHVPKLLRRLWSLGVARSHCPYGSRLSMQNVLTAVPPLRLHERPSPSSGTIQDLFRVSSHGSEPRDWWSSHSTRERASIDEILTNVDLESHLTFDFLALTLCAATIAAVGLVTDSPVVVVSSMLISPLMKPILVVTVGLAMCDWKAALRGLRDEAIGCLVAFVLGLLAGGLVGPIIMSTNLGGSWVLHSSEIESRGDPVGLLTGTALAAPSGVAVALCITGGASAALVGVAISASLLPPLVNSGICLMLALVWSRYHDLETKSGAAADPAVFYKYAAVSFGLYMLNLFTVILFGFLTFRWKRVSPSAIDYRSDVWMPQPERESGGKRASVRRGAVVDRRHQAPPPLASMRASLVSEDDASERSSLREYAQAEEPSSRPAEATAGEPSGYGTAAPRADPVIGRAYVNLTKAGV